jgi:hypothetical protein
MVRNDRLLWRVGTAALLALPFGLAPAAYADETADKLAADAENALEDEGYSKVAEDGDDQYWWNEELNRCLKLDVDGDRVDSLRKVNERECDSSRHKDDLSDEIDEGIDQINPVD